MKKILNNNSNINKKEYLFLRNEIMKRIGWHQEHTQKATTVSISVWSGSIALITYFFGKEYSNHEFISTPIVFMVLSLLMFFHILLIYPLSFKINENYFRISNIVTHLIRFYEKPIYENDNSYFSWETANAKLLNHYKTKKNDILKPVEQHGDELIYLSVISLVLFVIFSILGYYFILSKNNTIRNKNYIYLGFIFHLIMLLIFIIVVFKIRKYSSYKCIGDIAKIANEFWESYS